MSDEQSAPMPPEAPTSPAAPVTRTSVRPMWNVKFVGFLIVAIGLGIWGLADAVLIYPKRGQADVAYKLWQYLEQASEVGRVNLAGVADPQARRLELQAQTEMTDLERIELMWLDAIAMLQGSGFSRDLSGITANNQVLGPITASDVIESQPSLDGAAPRLSLNHEAVAARTDLADPRSMLTQLKAYWDTHTQPKPLSSYDIPSQWLFVLGGVLGIAWLLPRVISVNTTTYRYDPESKTLSMPGGATLTADEIVDVDGRKWDKFFLFVKRRDSPDEIKFDLYRWIPLEEWLAEMTRAAGLPWPGDQPKGRDEANTPPAESTPPPPPDPAS
ncbi:MAG: hypothetical protein AAGI30_04730 [Planctomycetota bacterium]